jgi:hypothetical protein
LVEEGRDFPATVQPLVDAVKVRRSESEVIAVRPTQASGWPTTTAPTLSPGTNPRHAVAHLVQGQQVTAEGLLHIDAYLKDGTPQVGWDLRHARVEWGPRPRGAQRDPADR